MAEGASFQEGRFSLRKKNRRKGREGSFEGRKVFSEEENLLRDRGDALVGGLIPIFTNGGFGSRVIW
ncbi:MAG: hypothetical protein M2R45_02255 [Verrucomicrobia subdivision 3 bacterium]|nr:hypothetical protein [Limisphaerales bacterium]MCS1413959.1 hypothetical protein [Limisphaerales bacterium]